jgi:hypothetical protein
MAYGLEPVAGDEIADEEDDEVDMDDGDGEDNGEEEDEDEEEDDDEDDMEGDEGTVCGSGMQDTDQGSRLYMLKACNVRYGPSLVRVSLQLTSKMCLNIYRSTGGVFA